VSRLGFLFTAATVLLLASACKRDPGPERVQTAKARYRELVGKGTSAKDPAFDEVLESLAKVPASSSARVEADALREAILRGRAAPPRRPLSGAAEGSSSKLEKECARLAESLGFAPAPERDSITRALAGCRKALEAERERAHPKEP
jgi:hypothetical protein